MSRTLFPVAVHLFLLRGSRILLLRRYNTGYEDGNYSVVAGHIDGGEHIYDAMIREAREEAGIDIALSDLQAVQVMHRRKGNEERIDYFFCCEKWHGEIKNAEPNKCDELLWADINNLPLNTVDYVGEAVKNYLAGKQFTIYGWKIV